MIFSGLFIMTLSFCGFVLTFKNNDNSLFKDLLDKLDKIMKVVFIFVFILGVYVQYNQERYLLKVSYDNNISYTKFGKYQNEVKKHFNDFTVEDFKNSLNQKGQ